MEVVIGFSMLKSIQKHRRGQDMSKRVNMPKCKEKLAEKSAERRKKKAKKGKGAKIARCLVKTIKVEINFILFVSTTLGSILLFKHFCILSWGAYSTNFHLFFL